MSDKSVGVYDASPARRRSQKYPVAAEKQHRKVMTEEAMRHDRPRLRGRGTHQEASGSGDSECLLKIKPAHLSPCPATGPPIPGLGT